jgi:hypothetical protein
MEYKIKKVTEEIDVLEITEDEYQATNDMYKEAILNLGFPVNYVRDLKVKKVILTDGLHRKEFVLQVNENALKDRKAAIEARHNYIESLDKKADKEQLEKLNEDLKE